MKKLAVVLAALMMLSTTTFLAAGSPNGGVTTTTPGVNAGTQTIETIEALNAAVNVLPEVEAEDIEAITVTELTGTVPADGKVTLVVSFVEAGDNIKVLHKGANGWEEREVLEVADGKVVADFDSFSPVAIVKLAAEETTAPNMYYWLASPFNTAAKLPKTGAVVVLPVAAMACLAGAVVCGRKEK